MDLPSGGPRRHRRLGDCHLDPLGSDNFGRASPGSACSQRAACRRSRRPARLRTPGRPGLRSRRRTRFHLERELQRLRVCCASLPSIPARLAPARRRNLSPRRHRLQQHRKSLLNRPAHTRQLRRRRAAKASTNPQRLSSPRSGRWRQPTLQMRPHQSAHSPVRPRKRRSSRRRPRLLCRPLPPCRGSAAVSR